MTSRTGHMMASASLQPLDERVREAQRAVTVAVDVEPVDESQTTSSTLASAVSSDSKVVLQLVFDVFADLTPNSSNTLPQWPDRRRKSRKLVKNQRKQLNY